MRSCLACSIAVDESGRFCPSCGAVLAEAANAIEPAVTQSSIASSVAGSLIGQTIDGFAIESVIGGGSFGTVYRGRQIGLDRVAALKVPTHEIAADPVMARRFAREARAAARIRHPGVVTIYAVGELPDGRPYLAMQLVEGEPLDRILADGPVAIERALGIARQIASALSETHAADVVHRDLKPTNIMWRVDRNGDDRITLVDFGIAVCRPGNADATRLTSGGLIGTPHYMSPEQAHGDLVDARADLYALGCLVFELITATTPYDGSGFEVLLAHLGRPAPRPSDRNRDVPEVVDALVGKLMAKRPDDRPQSADAVVASLDEALDALEAARSRGARPQRRRGANGERPSRPPGQSGEPAAQPGRPATQPGRSQAAPGRSATQPGATRRPAPTGPNPALDPAALRGRGGRALWAGLGALAAFALAGAAFVAFRTTSPGADAAALPAGGDPADSENNHASEPPRVFLDKADMRLKVWWRDDPIVAGDQVRLHLDLRNKLGAVIVADQLIVTVEDPTGQAAGKSARPRRRVPEQFGFQHRFPLSGRHVVRVFPPETARAFEFEVDVAARGP